MKGDVPEIEMAAGYPRYEDIVLTFEDPPTEAYQTGITAKINGKSVPAAYLDRTATGRLTIRAYCYATGLLGEPGRVHSGARKQ